MFKEFLEVPLPNEWWYVLMLVWVVLWKGMALWKAARLGQKWWFVGLLIINTFGILEIFYIYVFSKKQAGSHHARRANDVIKDEESVQATAAGMFDNAEPVEDLPAPAGEKKAAAEEEKKEATADIASSA